MNSENRSMIIGVALCILFYLGYTQYLNYRYPQPVKTLSESKKDSPEAAAPSVLPSSPTSSLTEAPPALPVRQSLSSEELSIENEEVRYHFSHYPLGMESVQLKKYRENQKKDGPLVELLAKPMYFWTGLFQEAQKPDPMALLQAQRSGRTLKFTKESGDFLIEAAWTIPEKGYGMDLVVTYTNRSKAELPLDAALQVFHTLYFEKSSSSFFAFGTPADKPRVVMQFAGSDDFSDAETLCDDNTTLTGSRKALDFIGFDNHYFVTTLSPKEGLWDYLVTKNNTPFATYLDRGKVKQGKACTLKVLVSGSLGTVKPGESYQWKWTGYFGPKDLDQFSLTNPKLGTTLGLGWLDMIAQPLLLAIKGVYKVVPNYGVAIILVTLLLKILFYPLVKQAAVSSAAMKKYNPQMAEIRTRYKEDPKRMQQELLKFMSTHKINPMKGCLPILPQIPVFFALFRVLSASIELRHAPFAFWITDLSSADPYLVTPLLLGVAMFVQQKLTPTAGLDKNQERILQFMPIVFTLMMLSLPSGMVLYMLTNSIMSIIQQQWLNKKIQI